MNWKENALHRIRILVNFEFLHEWIASLWEFFDWNLEHVQSKFGHE